MGIALLINEIRTPHFLYRQKFAVRRLEIIDPACTMSASLCTPPDAYDKEYAVYPTLIYPIDARVTDSFRIRLDALLRNVVVRQPNRHTLADKDHTTKYLAPGIRYLESKLTARLDAPGLVYDKSPHTLSNGQTFWNVRAERPGRYVGSVILDPPNIVRSTGEFVEFRIMHPEAQEFEIDILPARLDIRDLASAIAYALGSLLTLPGIVMFRREWIEWRERRRSLTVKNVPESRIISP